MRVNESDRVDFDEALLLEDNWVDDLAEDEFEAKKIPDCGQGEIQVVAGCIDSSRCIGKYIVIRRG